MHDMAKGLIELFSHKWTSVTIKNGWKQETGTVVTEDGGSLKIETTKHTREQSPGTETWHTVTYRYTLEFTAKQWAALRRYVCQASGCSEDSARHLLLQCMQDSLERHRDRDLHAPLAATGAALAGVLLVMALYRILTAMLQARDFSARLFNESVAVLPVSAYIAGLLLFALLIVLRFSRGFRHARLCAQLWGMDGAALEERLKTVVPSLDCTRRSAVNRLLALALAAGCVGMVVLTLMPEDMKMAADQRLAYYFEQDISPSRLDKAEAAAMQMAPESVVMCLQEQIEADQYFPGNESFCAGLLAVRLQKNGCLTQEQSAPLAESALKLVKLSDLTNLRLEYLPELISGCTRVYQETYVLGLSGKGFFGPAVLTAVGEGVKGLDMAALAKGYQRLKSKGMDGGAFLGGALGVAGTLDEVERLLRETPREYRAALADAYSQNMKTSDDTLAYLRMLLTLDLTGSEMAAIPLKFDWDTTNLLIDAQPTGKLPEGNYTILPLRRVEDLEVCSHKSTLLMVKSEEEVRALFPVHSEKDAGKQTVTLELEVFAGLPAGRVPAKAEEADLILLFDQQYQLGGYEVRETMIQSTGADEIFPKFDCVQRVSIYDARTGQCLMELGVQRTPARTLSAEVMRSIWEADVFRSSLSNEIKESCHGKSNQVWYRKMQQLVIEAAAAATEQ